MFEYLHDWLNNKAVRYFSITFLTTTKYGNSLHELPL